MNSEPARHRQFIRRCLSRRPLLVLLACIVFPAGCGRQPADGLEKFPVQGLVQVDGQPAAGVVVRFFKDGKPGTTNADTPLGVTDADGRFELSTNGDGDGAVAGNYRVTFTWKSGNSPASEDQLKGRYTRLDRSEINVTVRPEPNELDPFLLEVPGDKAQASTRSRGRARANPNTPATSPVR